jgi:hypothetical protein
MVKEIERAEAKDAETAKLFAVKALALLTTKTYSLNHPVLGVIRYGFLTSDEVKPLKLEALNDAERMYSIAYAMLKKADSAIKKADFDSLPFDVKALLTEALAKEMPSFLPPPQSSGSASQLKQKKQG